MRKQRDAAFVRGELVIRVDEAVQEGDRRQDLQSQEGQRGEKRKCFASRRIPDCVAGRRATGGTLPRISCQCK